MQVEKRKNKQFLAVQKILEFKWKPTLTLRWNWACAFYVLAIRSAHSSHTGPRKNTFEIYRDIPSRSFLAPLVTSIELDFLLIFPTDSNRVNNDKFQSYPNKTDEYIEITFGIRGFISSMLCFQINFNIKMSIPWKLNQDHLYLFVCILLILFAVFFS